MKSFFSKFIVKNGWVILITLLFNFGAIKFIYQYANYGMFIGYQRMAYSGEYAIYIISVVTVFAFVCDYILLKRYLTFRNNENLAND